VIECDPTDSFDVVSVALSVESSVPVPSVDVPSLNVTIPAGLPPVDDTIAVNVTDCLLPEGFTDELSAVVVVAAALLTICVNGAEVLPM
jgi:hypothetical protein